MMNGLESEFSEPYGAASLQAQFLSRMTSRSTSPFAHLSWRKVMRQWMIASILCLAVWQRVPGTAERCVAADVVAPDATRADAAFFETRVRPVLAERCYSCHSTRAEKLKGGLLLDSPSGILKGGDGGPVLVPGHPESSRLIEAVGYTNVDLQMPPKGRLTEQQVADLAAWVGVASGAPWPSVSSRAVASANRPGVFDWETRRRSHWAWQPIRRPTLPAVVHSDWIKTPVDQFILARLEHQHLSPAPPAAADGLIRRMWFDLVGLPPPSYETLSNTAVSDTAYAQAVAGLLAQPAFGERWARHWLDLVRYAETLGHEFDYENANAWRYRDYVIRALNADVPYPQFMMEHVAGDLLEKPRLNPVDGSNESIIGTTFYWLGQRDHSPVDVRQHQAELIDNQIDVLTKTFLGLTVACARCHDHKFDAIPTQDYYALYGMLSSSRYAQRALDAPDLARHAADQLRTLKQQLRAVVAQTWLPQVERAAQVLTAELRSGGGCVPIGPERTRSWPPQYEAFAYFDRTNLATWFRDGEAFSEQPSETGDFIVGDAATPVNQILTSPAAHSGTLSRRMQGTIRSPTFLIRKRYVHVLAMGHETRINVPVDDFTMIRDPIYGGLKRIVKSERWHWITIDLGMWQNHHAYVEFSDVSAPDPADDGHHDGYPADGYLAVGAVLFSDDSQPPRSELEVRLETLFESAEPLGPERSRNAAIIADAILAWAQGPEGRLASSQAALLNFLVRKQALNGSGALEAARLVAEYAQVEASIHVPVFVPAMVDGTGLDEPVFIRGNHRLPGDIVPRRFLLAIAGTNQAPIVCGSGRQELARRMAADENPFLARVMVNRVWLHLFGRGLVPTPDDFGALGQLPTHPELLDWLADWIRTEGQWSTKNLIRLLVTSNTYRMSSRPADLAAEANDPDNLLWHRMPVRRLEGEAIRDAILTVSGRINRLMYGESVPTHLTDFMEGRGRPSQSGPLDGDGRRSIYLEVSRNFISPMMRAFDMPVPFTTVGRRLASNVPAQSLTLMNDPFVVGEARRWARKNLSQSGRSPEERIEGFYEDAFHREPSAAERAKALAFLAQQGQAYGFPEASRLEREEVWADFCHVLLNAKEFIFIN